MYCKRTTEQALRVNHKEVVAYTSDLQARIKSNENKIASLEAALMETKAELQNVKQEYELFVLKRKSAPTGPRRNI